MFGRKFYLLTTALIAVAIGVAGITYPFYPRHLTIISTLTIGVPGFFLALAPATQAPPKPFLRDVAAFAVPAGLVLGVAVLLGHGLVHTSIGRSAAWRGSIVLQFWQTGISAWQRWGPGISR